jgi:hypothetical protein
MKQNFGGQWTRPGGSVHWPARFFDSSEFLAVGKPEVFIVISADQCFGVTPELNTECLSENSNKNKNFFFLKKDLLLSDNELKVLFTCMETT